MQYKKAKRRQLLNVYVDQRIIHTLLKLHAHVASLCETRGQDLSRLLPMVQENNAAAATRLLEVHMKMLDFINNIVFNIYCLLE